MEKIILGLLMIKTMTGYEMRSFIKHHLSLICSDSAGSFQTALQKLLVANMITCSEYVEKSINKKLYTITELGRSTFFQWEEQPMNHKKSKYMELGKLFFLGMLETEKRMPLLRTYISQLTEEQTKLTQLKENILLTEAAYLDEFTNNKAAMDRFRYQMVTLDYGIASLGFEIQWYGQLIEDSKEDGIS